MFRSLLEYWGVVFPWLLCVVLQICVYKQHSFMYCGLASELKSSRDSCWRVLLYSISLGLKFCMYEIFTLVLYF